MRSYDFRYLKADGSVSMFFKEECASDEQARRRALALAPADCANYEVWADSDRIAVAPILKPDV